MQARTDFLQWQSKLNLETVFQRSESMAYPTAWRDGVIYLSTLADEGGRATLMYREFSTVEQAEVLLPPPLNVRTRICEYGGKPFWLFGDELFFSNDGDQRLYRMTLGVAGQPERVSGNKSASSQCRFADVTKINDDYLLAVVEEQKDHQHDVEEHDVGHSEPASWLGVISLPNTPTDKVKPPQRLSPSADFFSNLVVDTNRRRLAWVQWQHPQMPWDETELWVSEYQIDAEGFQLVNPRRIDLPASASVCQLMLSSNGRLFFVVDFSDRESNEAANFWNIWCVDFAAKEVRAQPATKISVEFGYPHWQYGDCRLVQCDDNTALAIGSSAEQDNLYTIDTQSYQLTKIHSNAVSFQNLSSMGDGRALAIARFKDKGQGIVEFSTASPNLAACYGTSMLLGTKDISRCQHIAFPTAEGGEGEAYAYYYPPTNAKYTTTDDQLPPLIVMVHGGPTARAYGYFDLQKQFWTQRGFAIADINHRGSCGYGRRYRDALYGEWGKTDAADIATAVDELVNRRLADPERICIRGKSAGGYAVLRALTEYPELFRAGACYYGIGNLFTLAEATHKFERFYTDRLIDETFDPIQSSLPSSRFYQRSPINRVDRISAAMIVFQGSDDKVVPPTVAHEIIDALKVQNIAHKYVEYAAEGHGFRRLETNLDAWGQELQFYRKHLSNQSS